MNTSQRYNNVRAPKRPYRFYEANEVYSFARIATTAVCRSGFVKAPLLDKPTELTAEERWSKYLESLSSRGLVGATVVDAVERFWVRLVTSFPSLTPPDASPTNLGGLLMSWDRDGRHLEIEVCQDGATYEWFYRQRLLDVNDGYDGVSIELIDPNLLRRFNELMSGN